MCNKDDFIIKGLAAELVADRDVEEKIFDTFDEIKVCTAYKCTWSFKKY